MAKAPYPIVPTSQPPGWRDRHPYLKIVIGAALLVAFVAGLFVIVFSSFRASDVYKESLARAQADPQVQQWLGTPIEPGWLMTGDLKISGESGSADIAIPISGPRGKGSLYVVAFKSQGVWRYQRMCVTRAGGNETINLLAAQP